MTGSDFHASEQRVALRRVRRPGQLVLQRSRQLVAVQRHDAVVVVACAVLAL